jgi:hypothetical protein
MAVCSKRKNTKQKQKHQKPFLAPARTERSTLKNGFVADTGQVGNPTRQEPNQNALLYLPHVQQGAFDPYDTRANYKYLRTMWN